MASTFPNHPVYGKPLSGRQTTNGVELAAYRTGVNRAVWMTGDLRVKVDSMKSRAGTTKGYAAWVDDVAVEPMPRHGFKSFADAMAAAVAKVEAPGGDS